ncbi:MAG: DUF177 domain-containing protein [Hyphomicrobiales bacterium]|nr:DUF177 domain-containing protein [Hyphomicrobiales bacterium]
MTDSTEDRLWSSPLAVTDVPAHGLDVTLVADADVRRRLAAANGLVALASLKAVLHVARRGREGLRATGRVKARATQTCVVTLEPFEAEIDEPVDVEFEPERAAPKSGREAARGPAAAEESEGMDDLDAPDPIVDGRIDLGALAAEFLALGLDPYPRKPGAAFEPKEIDADKASPFAGLAALRGKTGDRD